MTERVWIWNFDGCRRLSGAVVEMFGDEQCAIVRTQDIDLSETTPVGGILLQKSIGNGFSWIKTSGVDALEAVLNLDDWNIDVVLIPGSAREDDVVQLVCEHAFADSRGLGIESMHPSGVQLLAKWSYSIWLSFGAVDAKGRCLIRCVDQAASNAVERVIGRFGRLLGFSSEVLAAHLKQGEAIERSDVPVLE